MVVTGYLNMKKGLPQNDFKSIVSGSPFGFFQFVMILHLLLQRPFSALLQLGSRIKALVPPHAAKHFTGEFPAFSAMVQVLFFAAGFHSALPAPKRRGHLQTALAVHLFFSCAAVTADATSRFMHYNEPSLSQFRRS